MQYCSGYCPAVSITCTGVPSICDEVMPLLIEADMVIGLKPSIGPNSSPYSRLATSLLLAQQ